ncbi:efflux RND transporter permease subunit [Methylovirgula sp. 4M-Z18]|uniref:efflux RND transporter permease subunit n=1 Tax=Methylovirgula sp. 4M-Z18 TaxID=2293567 RepID=UPI000E2F453C|nr:multidrug efflux RND transporter permease subunit [Methylovirgula sp. 4M-Z18]RFB79762.1 multidrug efflux RND transporter permease subunit [Methylovirgula sp. 4M-Z18]
MEFSKFFIDRPIFAAVLSIVIFVAGLITIPLLPIGEYPDVVPPTVIVRATYPGANPKVIAETVSVPLEEQINGAENMMYMKSVAGSDGVLQMTITFRPGTDPNKAQVDVQNRVAQAQSRLPAEVVSLGVTTQKQSPSFLTLITLISDKYDPLYLRNYANIKINDELARIPGVGQVQLFGGGDYAMRIWLDPDKVASRGLTAGDVVRAVQEQNIQVSAGQLGAEPIQGGADFLVAINAQGRLRTPEEFGNIVLKTGTNGEVVRLSDVGRIELGASDYTLRGKLDNYNTSVIGVFQAPGANTLTTRDAVIAKMDEIAKQFPPGMSYRSDYDITVFVRDSINAVIHTLLEAIGLVVIVVILFLQTWRASIIPLIAVPVSVIGTFAILYLLGFSINTLSLFGLVLAIGIVVDDAIVVVENVERNISEGLSPLAAAHQAMKEVSGPIIAIALVLCAVFVPMAFLTGVTGQFYKQFAVTIAISTVISAINSLTLSPALAAKLLRAHDAPKDLLSRLIEGLFGWLFRPFNRFFNASSNGYQGSVSRILKRRGIAFVIYAVLLAGTGFMFNSVPRGFIPTQDKLYLIAGVKLPEGSSLERTDAVLQRMKSIALSTDGVGHVVAMTGLNPTQFTNTPNYGVAFVILKPFNERHRSAKEIADDLQMKISGIKEGLAFVLNPPPINGLGNGAGYSMFIEDRTGAGFGALQQGAGALQGTVMKTPSMGFPFVGYQSNVPQLNVDVDRVKAKTQGVALTDLFETLQVYLGSSYVNDFNLFGRTWRVYAQADGDYRKRVEDIANLKTRNDRGDMVPIGSMVKINQTYGPDPVLRYNGYPAADFVGEANPATLSSAQAMDVITALAEKVLPNGMGIEWTDLSFQEATQGKASLIVFPVAILLAFLVLAALYESWVLPLAVILIVPMCMLAALTGVKYTGGDNNTFVQVGLVVLMGLACKNAILIVEFARELEFQGKGIVEAALEACRLRLRPIIMTSVAFIAGTVPLVLSHGAGAEVRSATGITVFSGMIGVTLFGLFLTPVFYVGLRFLSGRKLVQHGAATVGHVSEAHGTPAE